MKLKMKKKIILLLSAMSICLAAEPCTVNASQLEYYFSSEDNTTVEYLPNGDYITEIMSVENTIQPYTSTPSSKTASKTIQYTDASNKKYSSYKLTATFSYNKTTSKCTEASCSFISYSDNWILSSQSAKKSGDTAIGNVTAKRKVDGIVLNTIRREIKLKCSASGAIS